MKILILARMSSHFHGNTVFEKPLGGSESALLYLSREMAKLGHQIVIYNNVFDKAGIYEGVEYKHFTTLANLVKFSKTDDFDIFISFRDLPAFLFPIKAKKRIWWGHDDFSNVWNYNDYKKYLGAAFLRLAGFLINKYCDELFVVSNWLKKICIDKVYIKPEKVYVTKNGVNWEYFETKTIGGPSPRPSGTPLPTPAEGVLGEGPGVRVPRLVYTSVPDRDFMHCGT